MRVGASPEENFKVLYPNGTDEVRDGKVVRGGGIEWTIRDGVPFHVPTLSKEIREMVLNARKGQNREQ